MEIKKVLSELNKARKIYEEQAAKERRLAIQLIGLGVKAHFEEREKEKEAKAKKKLEAKQKRLKRRR